MAALGVSGSAVPIRKTKGIGAGTKAQPQANFSGMAMTLDRHRTETTLTFININPTILTVPKMTFFNRRIPVFGTTRRQAAALTTLSNGTPARFYPISRLL